MGEDIKSVFYFDVNLTRLFLMFMFCSFYDDDNDDDLPNVLTLKKEMCIRA